MAKLSLSDQRELVKTIEAQRKNEIKKFVRERQMAGEGVKEIATKVRNFLTPIAREVSPIILRELIIPYLIKEGKQYLGLSETTKYGGALKLAGQGKKIKSGGQGKKKK